MNNCNEDDDDIEILSYTPGKSSTASNHFIQPKGEPIDEEMTSERASDDEIEILSSTPGKVTEPSQAFTQPKTEPIDEEVTSERSIDDDDDEIEILSFTPGKPSKSLQNCVQPKGEPIHEEVTRKRAAVDEANPPIPCKRPCFGEPMLILDTEETVAAEGENEATDTPIKSLSATPILQGRSIHENGADIKPPPRLSPLAALSALRSGASLPFLPQVKVEQRAETIVLMAVSPSKTSIARTPLHQSPATALLPSTTPVHQSSESSVDHAIHPTPLNQLIPSATSTPDAFATPPPRPIISNIPVPLTPSTLSTPAAKPIANPRTGPTHHPAQTTPSTPSIPSPPAAIDQAALIAAFGVWLQESPLARAQLQQISGGAATDAETGQQVEAFAEMNEEEECETAEIVEAHTVPSPTVSTPTVPLSAASNDNVDAEIQAHLEALPEQKKKEFLSWLKQTNGQSAQSTITERYPARTISAEAASSSRIVVDASLLDRSLPSEESDSDYEKEQEKKKKKTGVRKPRLIISTRCLIAGCAENCINPASMLAHAYNKHDRASLRSLGLVGECSACRKICKNQHTLRAHQSKCNAAFAWKKKK